MLIRRPAAVGAALLLVAAGTAQAGEPDAGGNRCQRVKFCVHVDVDGKTGGKNRQAGSQGGSADSKQKCKYTQVEPAPAANHPAWKGADPKKNKLYFYACDGASNNLDGFIAVPDGQPPVPQVDPRELAQRAVDSMTLLGPDININPSPDGKGLVGMPVWMAVDRSPTTWGPNTASASAGGITVTATAKVSRIVWAMGDGSSVTCTAPGTPYQKVYGLKTSPDCGHVYHQPSTDAQGGRYKVTATSTWVIDWQVDGGGAAGQLTEIRSSSVAVTIVESQAVNS